MYYLYIALNNLYNNDLLSAHKLAGPNEQNRVRHTFGNRRTLKKKLGVI